LDVADGGNWEGGPRYDVNMRWVYKNQEVAVDRTCVKHYRAAGEEEKCMFAQYVAPLVDTPLFALQVRSF
jgi:hypothetical protein